jgi:capsular exopolysaccharide synthesis family protein
MNVLPLSASQDHVQSTDQGEEALQLRAIYEVLSRRFKLITLIAALVAALGAAITLLLPPRYTATALLGLSPGQERVIEPEQMVTGAPSVTPGALVDSEIAVLRSRMLIRRLVDELNLLNDPNLNPQRSQSNAARENIVSTLSAAQDVRRFGAGYTVEIAFTSSNPQLSAELANGLADLYLRYQVSARSDSAARATAWLSQRLDVLRTELETKEAAAEEYRRQSGLLATQGSLLSEREATEALAVELQARSDLVEKQARLNRVQAIINSGGSLDALAAVLDSAVIRDLRSREADANRRLAELREGYQERHPDIQAVLAERSDIQAQIRREVDRITENLGNEVEIARDRLNMLRASLRAARGELSSNNAARVRLEELEREASATRAVYERFLERYHEVSDQGSMQSTDARIISRATPSEAGALGFRLLGFAISAAVGLLFGLAVGLAVDALNDTIRSDSEVRRKTGLTHLASVPKVRSAEMGKMARGARNPAGYLIGKPVTPFAESFRLLRASLLNRRHDRPNVIAITSALANEGKTTVALCLSHIAALSNQRVVALACDLRRPTLNRMLGLEPNKGLLEVLRGEIGWREALYRDEKSGLSVLPLSDAPRTAADALDSDAMARVLGELRSEYDLIVLDCAPALVIADTRIIAHMADATILVARWNHTRTRAVRHAIGLLNDDRIDLAGLVLNMVDPKAPDYYYAAQRQYYRGS